MLGSDSITIVINQIRLRHLADFSNILADSRLKHISPPQWQSAVYFLRFAAAVRLPNLAAATALSDSTAPTPLAYSGEISYLKGTLALQMGDTTFACTHFNAALTEGDTLSLAYRRYCPSF